MNSRTKSFLESEQGIAIREQLMEMTASEKYNTKSRYSVSDPGGQSFVEKHMKYMSLYPNMNHIQYVSNLKLMTKQKVS